MTEGVEFDFGGHGRTTEAEVEMTNRSKIIWPMAGMSAKEKLDWLMEKYIGLQDEIERLRAAAVGADVGAKPDASSWQSDPSQRFFAPK